MRYKIKINDLLLVLLWLSVFPIQLPGKMTYVIQAFLVLTIFLNSFSEIKRIQYNFLILLFPITITISCFLNKNSILITQVLRGVTYSLLIIDVYTYIHRYIRLAGEQRMLAILYKLSKCYFVFGFVWTIALVMLGKPMDTDIYMPLGGKFNSAYIFLIFLILFRIQQKDRGTSRILKDNVIFIVLSILCIWTCVLLQVSTGIVAIVFFAALIFVPNDFTKCINNAVVFIALIIGSMVIVFSISTVLNLHFVQNIVVDILHEDLSLTGRTALYELLLPQIFKSGMFGGGFGSYIASQLGYHGWLNAQNGLSEVILTYGFCGAITFLILCFASSKGRNGYYKSLNAGIITFIFIAIVEVPFDIRFIFLLALFMLVNEDNQVSPLP